jgi:hypothetical protein
VGAKIQNDAVTVVAVASSYSKHLYKFLSYVISSLWELIMQAGQKV